MAATTQTVSLHNCCFNISPKSFKKNMVPCNLYVLEKIAVIVFESLFAGFINHLTASVLRNEYEVPFKPESSQNIFSPKKI